jgi:hypothetical protein
MLEQIHRGQQEVQQGQAIIQVYQRGSHQLEVVELFTIFTGLLCILIHQEYLQM